MAAKKSKKIKVQDLKPKKDAKGGMFLTPGHDTTGKNNPGKNNPGFHNPGHYTTGH